MCLCLSGVILCCMLRVVVALHRLALLNWSAGDDRCVYIRLFCCCCCCCCLFLSAYWFLLLIFGGKIILFQSVLVLFQSGYSDVIKETKGKTLNERGVIKHRISGYFIKFIVLENSVD